MQVSWSPGVTYARCRGVRVSCVPGVLEPGRLVCHVSWTPGMPGKPDAVRGHEPETLCHNVRGN